MFALNALIGFILFMDIHYAKSADSDYAYNQKADIWLRLHKVPAIWTDAGMRCHLEGGILASPTSVGMAQAMSDMMKEHKLSRGIFTGINSILFRENFKSLEGVPLSSIPLGWAPGEPDNANSDEDCVALTGEGKLADVSCNSVLPYICRKENKCGPKDNGYEWEPRTGRCYKFHREANTWRKALSTCHAEGGHLAIINSETESTVLMEIYDRNPAETVIRADERRYAFIGFSKYYDDVWATTNGDTLVGAGFAGWAPNQPNNFEGNDEFCGSVSQNGRLNDANCQLKLLFVCEIIPE